MHRAAWPATLRLSRAGSGGKASVVRVARNASTKTKPLNPSKFITTAQKRSSGRPPSRPHYRLPCYALPACVLTRRRSDDALREPFDEGAFRDVALGYYIDEEGNAGAPCVAKWLKDEWATSRGSYREDMRCVRRALQFVRAFNAARIFDSHLRVVVPALARFGSDTALPDIVHLREPFLDDYEKCMSTLTAAPLPTL